MFDEVTLLNILRAKEQMPLHCTGFNRLFDGILVMGAAKLNAGVKGSGLTGEDDRQSVGGVITDTRSGH